jgi:hypothetical protein
MTRPGTRGMQRVAGQQQTLLQILRPAVFHPLDVIRAVAGVELVADDRGPAWARWTRSWCMRPVSGKQRTSANLPSPRSKRARRGSACGRVCRRGCTICRTQIGDGPISPAREDGLGAFPFIGKRPAGTMARYSFSTSRRSKIMPSSRAAARVFGHEDQTAGVAVEAVDDGRAGPVFDFVGQQVFDSAQQRGLGFVGWPGGRSAARVCPRRSSRATRR